MKVNHDNDLLGTDTIREGYKPVHAGDQSHGSVRMEPHDNMIAGDFVTLTFTYVVGPQGLAEGGVLRIGTPCTGWGEPLPPRSRYWFSMQPPAYYRRNISAEVTTDGEAHLVLGAENKMLRYVPPGGSWRWWTTIQVAGGSLAPGDKIVLLYGDKSWGEHGIQTQKFPEADAYFEVLVDVNGDGRYVEISDSPLMFDVVTGGPSKLSLTLPSLVARGEAANVRVALTDDFANLAQPQAAGPITVDNAAAPQESALLLHQESDEMALARSLPLPVKRPDVYQFVAQSDRLAISGKSNPVRVLEEAPQERIYWGDLHSQSKFHGPGSWSVGTPDELYEYARTVSQLDFAAITDDAAPIGEGWLPIQQAAIDHYEPGAFVTFKAFEWCSKKYGHRNTIFAGTEIEDHYPRSLFDSSIEAFWDYFRAKNVIMIPHHTLVWTDWAFHDPELEPLVEIYSIWGASEKAGNPIWTHSQDPSRGMQAALARGYRLGVIGSTDTHAGTPGRSVPNADRFDWQPEKGGLAAVYAPELTRQAIFDALKARRTYGTTGARIILDFQVNGHAMGSEAALAAGQQPRLAISAVGSDRIRKVEIVRNNCDVHQIEVDDYEVDLEWTDAASPLNSAATNEASAAFYYVRLTQVDGEMAWSSPVWLHRER